MANQTFMHLGMKQISEILLRSRGRVIFCAPGVHQPVAAAIVNARIRMGRENVRVVLDVNDSTARMGYGDFDAVALLMEGDVDVRTEAGLRTCVFIADEEGYAFFSPPMLVELQDDQHVGVNAIFLLPEQVRSVTAIFLEKPKLIESTPPVPEIGALVLTEKKMAQVKESLDANPPQKFDLARKVNVFNAFVEFVEIKLTGLHIAKHTVQLPSELVMALRDDSTSKRLLTTFRLVSEDSKVAKEAADIDKKVRALRERFTRPLGDGLGSVILRSKLSQLQDGVTAIQTAIELFQLNVKQRLEKEIELSRKKLVEGLLPAIQKNPPDVLKNQVSGKISVEIFRRYIDDELKKVFPEAKYLIGEMKLEWVQKGVTYETLKNNDFQKRVRSAFPYEDWDKPFSEFDALAAADKLTVSV